MSERTDTTTSERTRGQGPERPKYAPTGGARGGGRLFGGPRPVEKSMNFLAVAASGCSATSRRSG